MFAFKIPQARGLCPTMDNNVLHFRSTVFSFNDDQEEFGNKCPPIVKFTHPTIQFQVSLFYLTTTFCARSNSSDSRSQCFAFRCLHVLVLIPEFFIPSYRTLSCTMEKHTSYILLSTFSYLPFMIRKNLKLFKIR